ncbi:hypothetical protein PILCRDRAFT_925 [Piloderma croceum F 1598]|uniref:Uncharacterized protein n=1 Tax=Piloderma croceum (strain F 1598) TaxID=765440 RepID=A0A0C3CLW0_PILCF|nr:hypothetical protein PILCRDRAFT_925 [Piloderma croceum F 1598]
MAQAPWKPQYQFISVKGGLILPASSAKVGGRKGGTNATSLAGLMKATARLQWAEGIAARGKRNKSENGQLTDIKRQLESSPNSHSFTKSLARIEPNLLRTN